MPIGIEDADSDLARECNAEPADDCDREQKNRGIAVVEMPLDLIPPNVRIEQIAHVFYSSAGRLESSLGFDSPSASGKCWASSAPTACTPCNTPASNCPWRKWSRISLQMTSQRARGTRRAMPR